MTERPIRTEYSLTKKGHELGKALDVVARFGLFTGALSPARCHSRPVTCRR
ncbi:hypothetical protein [Streptomyces sp. NPDC096934]|uniref:hypothetical protein n=1 Tax=Streptomyces sp. NPDC096934 TaxID=3155551 RepID=UPI00332B50DC